MPGKISGLQVGGRIKTSGGVSVTIRAIPSKGAGGWCRVLTHNAQTPDPLLSEGRFTILKEG
ncbi:hypothetical protein A3A64_00185 [Candidatus Gottesmanbacteria bacterium RIFCSPLOWO2_01_FULL_48_11]|nr:MAG: hypothetical protein A3A64_00185 [Candidatus Gottesmanbacteria bacterium RIFCSPLOWO2_01_FULL_48_11]